ncbi:hypothetical protein A3B39_04510 [Candidatus Daviesbacteria bacterium RIFCSPLOWO2_01_FULL_37_10]|nr:MAG: hypothetical protein A3B39_04510 [Candidatus Daviesbacteria bacterium RIFCSPLOWO2_01_FULL_37_10]
MKKVNKFAVLGLILIGIFLVWKMNNQPKLEFEQLPNQVNISKESTNRPVFISIPNKQVSLTVTDSKIINNKWETSQTGASHLSVSANPGTPGNIVIFGHNKQALFGKIRQLKLGDSIYLTDNNGKKYGYNVVEILTVRPSQIEVLNKTDYEVLTLYTCSGFADSLRFIVKAYPLKEV